MKADIGDVNSDALSVTDLIGVRSLMADVPEADTADNLTDDDDLVDGDTLIDEDEAA